MVLDFIDCDLFPGIKKFIVGLVIKMSSSDTLQQQRVYVGKLNMILVQVSALTFTRNLLNLSRVDVVAPFS